VRAGWKAQAAWLFWLSARRFTLAGFLTGFLAIDLTRLQLLAVNESSLRSTGVWFDMSKLFARFLNDESGATAIEYGLIAAGIALAIIAVVNGLGTNLNEKFTSINSSLK
jgi:pilus assembly protein Flp/PilA